MGGWGKEQMTVSDGVSGWNFKWLCQGNKHPLEGGKYLLLPGPCRKLLTKAGLNGRSLGHQETQTSSEDVLPAQKVAASGLT